MTTSRSALDQIRIQLDAADSFAEHEDVQLAALKTINQIIMLSTDVNNKIIFKAWQDQERNR